MRAEGDINILMKLSTCYNTWMMKAGNLDDYINIKLMKALKYLKWYIKQAVG